MLPFDTEIRSKSLNHCSLYINLRVLQYPQAPIKFYVSTALLASVPSSLCSTIKVWDLAAALDAGSSSDALCIATLKVG